MTVPRLARLTLPAAAVAAGAAVLIAGSATGATGAKITPQGVGAVKLGATATSLQADGLIGKLRTGCELAGPGTRAAQLTAPLKGTVDFTMSNPRKVDAITIYGGTATARGVGIGASTADVLEAYPGAKVDKDLRETFGGDFIRVSKKAGGKIEFFVDQKTKKVETIGVPAIPLCE